MMLHFLTYTICRIAREVLAYLNAEDVISTREDHLDLLIFLHMITLHNYIKVDITLDM